MGKPVTPLVACDVFIVNEADEVLLIRRSDNDTWALPGGCHDLGETPKECAARECFEETGYKAEITDLIAVFSSNRYEFVNYPWKDNEFCHLLFRAKIVGGTPMTSSETKAIKWFKNTEIPELCDGHDIRIKTGFASLHPKFKPFFE